MVPASKMGGRQDGGTSSDFQVRIVLPDCRRNRCADRCKQRTGPTETEGPAPAAGGRPLHRGTVVLRLGNQGHLRRRCAGQCRIRFCACGAISRFTRRLARPRCNAPAFRRSSLRWRPIRRSRPRPKELPTRRAVSPPTVSLHRRPQEPLKELKVPNMRPTQEARFVSRNCREDHSLLCQGVPFGQVLKCLASQQARLSKDCRNAIARR